MWPEWTDPYFLFWIGIDKGYPGIGRGITDQAACWILLPDFFRGLPGGVQNDYPGNEFPFMRGSLRTNKMEWTSTSELNEIKMLIYAPRWDLKGLDSSEFDLWKMKVFFSGRLIGELDHLWAPKRCVLPVHPKEILSSRSQGMETSSFNDRTRNVNSSSFAKLEVHFHSFPFYPFKLELVPFLLYVVCAPMCFGAFPSLLLPLDFFLFPPVVGRGFCALDWREA